MIKLYYKSLLRLNCAFLLILKIIGLLIVAQWVKTPACIHKDVGSIPGLPQWVK